MKKIFLSLALAGGVWAGAQLPQINSASAQTSAFTGMVLPLTNSIVTTNSVAVTTNLSTIQLSDVLTILLRLQTNVEQTLPVIDLVESNVTLVRTSTPSGVRGAFAPITSNPAGFSLPPTGAASGSSRSQPTALSVTIGTNTFAIDPATIEALVTLRDDLQRTLPVLQQLNGTTPAVARTSTFLNPAVRSFTPAPLTGSFLVPLTNSSRLPNSGMESPF